MPANLNTRTLFILPERLTGAEFFASVATFTLNNWAPDDSIVPPWTSGPVTPEYDPLGAGIKMNLQHLYIVVLSMGGYEAIESAQRWSLVALRMGLWSENQFHVRETYEKYLLCYELYSRRVRRLFVARKRKYRDSSEYHEQALIEGQEDNDKEDYQVSCLSWSALESQIECEKQGVLDGMIVLRDYFSLSPAIQLLIKQQTYLLSLKIFTNQGEGPSAFFTPPQSVSPSAAVSLSDYSIYDSSYGDEDLSEEVRACKEAILSANRYHIIRTQKNMPPRPLPSYSRVDLAPFMYDDVKITLKRRERDRVVSAPALSESMAKLGFVGVPVRVKAKSYSSADSNNGDEVGLGEYIDRNRNNSEIEMINFQEELVTKYGMRPHVEKPVEPRVVEKSLNFEEYISAHGLDAPEVRRFFDDRLKLEGGFWQHELDRMDALERRVRGEELTSNKAWDRVSSDGSASSSEDSSGVDSPSDLPYYEQRPISLHERARIVSRNRDIPLKWDYPDPVEPLQDFTSPTPSHEGTSPDMGASRLSDPVGVSLRSLNLFRPTYIQENDDEVDLRRNTVNHEIQHSRNSVPLWAVTSGLSAAFAGGFQAGQGIFTAAYGPRIASMVPLEREAHLNPMIWDPMSANGMRRILSPPHGTRIDITNMNPRSSPSYNYTRDWLQKRALDDAEVLQDWEGDDQDDVQQSPTSGYLPSGASWRKEIADERLYKPALLQEEGGAGAEREELVDALDLVGRALTFAENGNSNLQVMHNRRSLERSRRRNFTVSRENPAIGFCAKEMEGMGEEDEAD